MDTLGQRLWNQFEEILQKQKENKIIYQLKINPDEVEALHSVAKTFSIGPYTAVRNNLRKYWTYEGLLYLLLFTFTKYVHQSNERFWEDWMKWTGADSSSDLHNTNIYHYLKIFSDRHNLFLHNPNRNEYVGSIKTQAFMGCWTIERVLSALFFLAMQHPYHLDQFERDQYLSDTLEQIGEKPSGNIDNEDEHEALSFHFRKSFRLAAYLQKEIVYKELLEVFKELHNVVLFFVSQSNRSYKTAVFSELYIQTHIESFIETIQTGKFNKEINDTIQESKGKRYQLRRPGLFLDVEKMLLTLHVPEQRVFNSDARSSYSVLVHYGEKQIKSNLEFRIYNDKPYCTREKDIPLEIFNGELAWEVYKNTTLIQLNSIKQSVIYFRTNGNRIDLPLKEEQEILILIPENCVFESDDAIINRVQNTNYSIALLHCTKETLFYVDNLFISPFATNIPDFTENNKKAIYSSVKILDSENQTNPVYHTFPSFSIRTKNESILREEYPLFINETQIPYIITQRIPLCDGTDDFLYHIEISETEILKSGINLYALQIGQPSHYSRTICIATHLSFSFTANLYFSDKDVRVKSLNFDNAESLFNGSYLFPMKDNNTRFRINLNNKEYRLALQPPLIEYSLDGHTVPETLWYENIAGKNLCLVSEIEYLKVFIQYANKSRRELYPMRTANKRIFSLTSLDQDKFLRSDPVQIVVNCKQQDKTITTIYFKFDFLEEPRFYCNDYEYTNTSLRIGSTYEKKGLFLLGKIIGSENEEYKGVLIYKATGQQYNFSIKPKGSMPQTVFITEKYVVNGPCFLSIRRTKKIFGQKELLEVTEYQNDFPRLYEEAIVEKKEIILTSGSILEGISSDCGSVHNFFLEIDDELSGNDGYIANGYFYHPDGRKVLHTLFNPYIITNISIDGDKLQCSITDKDGLFPMIDQFGRVNPIKANDTPLKRINKIHATIINSEDMTYDF